MTIFKRAFFFIYESNVFDLKKGYFPQVELCFFFDNLYFFIKSIFVGLPMKYGFVGFLFSGCLSVQVLLAPSNTAAEIGKNVTLACIVSNKQPSENVQWKHVSPIIQSLFFYQSLRDYFSLT